jgi:hypothetical protein
MVADSRYLRKRVVASFKSRVVTLTTVFAYNSLMLYLGSYHLVYCAARRITALGRLGDAWGRSGTLGDARGRSGTLGDARGRSGTVGSLGIGAHECV